ncbi:MAG: DUF6169 family protein [Bacteroidota bacterium]
MTEELDLPCLYKVFLDTESNTYYFQTQTGAHYEIFFIDSTPLFTSTLIEGCQVSSITIYKTKDGTGIRDNEIAKTVEAVLEHFFRDRNRILIYTCDGEDKKHFQRSRLFNQWFSKSLLKKSISKLDYRFKVEDSETLSSMIYHQENEYGSANITEAFDDVSYVLANKDNE